MAKEDGFSVSVQPAHIRVGVMENHDDQVMTVREVSAFLRLAESTVYKLALEGKLPGRKVGGTWRFSRRGLEEWLKRPERKVNQTGTDMTQVDVETGQ